MAADGYTGLTTLEIHPLKAGPLNYGHAARRLGQALDYVRLYTAPPISQQTGELAERSRAADE
jgi:hypothetical protein